MKFTYYTQPYALQKKCVEDTLFAKYHFVKAEQGCGKTKITLDTAVNLFAANEIDACIVITPKAIVDTWKDEYCKHVSPDFRLRIKSHFYHSSSAGTQKAYRARQEFLHGDTYKLLVMSPDSVITKAGAVFFQSVLKQFRTLLVIDESGKVLKNHRTKRSKALLTAAKSAAYRRCLSGTPITNNPLDLWCQYRFLSEHIFTTRFYTAFVERYAVTQTMSMGARTFQKIVGYKNLEDLVKIVSPFTTSILKKDMVDLPPKVYTTAYVELAPEQRRLYDQLNKDSVAFPGANTEDMSLAQQLFDTSLDKVTAKNVLTKMLRLQQIVSGYAVLDSTKEKRPVFFDAATNNPRIVALLDILDTCNEKVIIWCRFVDDITTIQQVINDTKEYAAVTYYGALNDAQRKVALNAFKHTEGVKVLVANPSCAGMGLTLTEADTAIYYSQDFSLANRLQSEDRCHRIGQTKTVRYITIAAKKTVDEHISRILLRKSQYVGLLDN